MKIIRALWVCLLIFVIVGASTYISSAVTWSDEFRLTTFRSFEGLPSVAQTSDGKIWVAWQSDVLGNSDILYRIYDGLAWTELYLLTSDTNNDISPSILQFINGTICIFWSSDRAGNYDIFCKTTQDGGLSWSSEKPLIDHPNNDNAPSAFQSTDGTLWVVWHRKFPTPSGPTYDIFYKTYNGAWSEEEQLTTDDGLDEMPSISQTSDAKIWVVWCSNRLGDFEIFYKVYNGTSWGNPTPSTSSSNMDVDPSITQTSNGTTWIVWASSKPTGGATDDLYYKTSINNGDTWSESIQLTTDTSQDSWPSITPIDGKGVCVVWASDRYTNYDVFYKVSWVPDIAVVSVSSSRTSAAQGNEVVISVEVRNDGQSNESFAVTAYCNLSEISTQMVTDLYPSSSTTLTFTWDTTDFSPDFYVISASATQAFGESDFADNSLTDGMVQITIPGDVDRDNDVDIADLSFIARALGTDPDWPHGTGWDEWNSDCDINDDDKVDISDLTIAGKNYGSTVE